MSGKAIRSEQEHSIPQTKFGDEVLPLVFCRSALFATAQIDGPAKPWFSEKPVAAFGAWNIYYTGQILNQHDLDAWIACLRIAYKRKARQGATIAASRHEILGEMGVAYSGRAAAILVSRMNRLRTGLLKIDGPICIHRANLLKTFNEEKGRDMVEFAFDEYLTPLLEDHIAAIRFGAPRKLKSPLAKWIYRYASTCANNEIGIGIDKIREWSGNAEEIIFTDPSTKKTTIRGPMDFSEFRSQVRAACSLILSKSPEGEFIRLEVDRALGSEGRLMIHRSTPARLLMKKESDTAASYPPVKNRTGQSVRFQEDRLPRTTARRPENVDPSDWNFRCKSAGFSPHEDDEM